MLITLKHSKIVENFVKLEIVLTKHYVPTMRLSIRMISQGNLLTIFYRLTKSDATCPNYAYQTLECSTSGWILKTIPPGRESKIGGLCIPALVV